MTMIAGTDRCIRFIKWSRTETSHERKKYEILNNCARQPAHGSAQIHQLNYAFQGRWVFGSMQKEYEETKLALAADGVCVFGRVMNGRGRNGKDSVNTSNLMTFTFTNQFSLENISTLQLVPSKSK